MLLPHRPRILRKNEVIRNLLAETKLQPQDFIVPLFIDEGDDVKIEIPSMPGYYRCSLDHTLATVKELWNMGLRAVLLFVKVKDKEKDNSGHAASNPDGLMQRSIKEIKNILPEMIIMTDVALDPYSLYGHDGIVEGNEIINDETVYALVQMSLSHAACGADFLAPSDMMDGRVGAIREALEENGYSRTGIMSYSAKYASSFYGPFRDALESAPGFGDKKTYQMNTANRLEALREVQLDVQEGADIVMIKPALAYLDIIREVKNTVHIPVSAYQVSGEYAMIKAAAANGWIDEQQAILETLTSIKRAGADLIATYFAKEAVKLLG